MQKFQNNIQDQFGNELTGATITVRNVVGGALSAIFSDDGVTPLGNPFTAQLDSEFFFYAANGRYDIFVTGPVTDNLLDVVLFDSASAPASNLVDGTVQGQVPRWDTGGATYEPATGVLFLAAGSPPVAGEGYIQLLSTSTTDEERPQIYMFAAGTVSAQYFVETSVNDGFYLRTRGNVSPDRHSWGFTLASTDTDIFEITEDLEFNLLQTMFMVERAAPLTDVLGRGQFWVRNDAPNTPMFTDDVGTDFVLNAFSIPIVLLDNEEIQFGTGNDAQIDFNGTNLVINSSGPILFTGSNVLVRGGNIFAIYDATNADFVSFMHTGTNLRVQQIGTGAIIIEDTLDIRFEDNGELQFGSGADVQFAWNATNLTTVGPAASVWLISGFDQVRIANALGMNEAATPDGNVAGVGQFWVQSEGDNVPMFTSDAGTEQLLDPSRSDVNEQNGNYTLLLADKGKTISKVSGGAGETYTIPANASVAFKIGTFVAFNNDGGGTLTIAITTDTLVFADDNSVGSRTLADGGYAVAQKVAATTWKIAGSNIT